MQKGHIKTAEKDTLNQQRKNAQKVKRQFLCEDEKVENVWIFKYLNSRFRADGDQLPDIVVRIAAATTTADKMRSVWTSKTVSTALKI